MLVCRRARRPRLNRRVIRQGPDASEITLIETARIACPHCQSVTAELMPDTACLHFWPCPVCGRTLTPRSGDCCVFCSYGDAICPPRRRQREALA